MHFELAMPGPARLEWQLLLPLSNCSHRFLPLGDHKDRFPTERAPPTPLGRLALRHPLTLRPLGVELLHRVVKPDADRGEAHLALQAGHQTAVEAGGSFVLHHRGHGAKDSPVLGRLGCHRQLALSLDLHGGGRRTEEV